MSAYTKYYARKRRKALKQNTIILSLVLVFGSLFVISILEIIKASYPQLF